MRGQLEARKCRREGLNIGRAKLQKYPEGGKSETIFTARVASECDTPCLVEQGGVFDSVKTMTALTTV